MNNKFLNRKLSHAHVPNLVARFSVAMLLLATPSTWLAMRATARTSCSAPK